jgi:hypothetical protein
MVAQCGEIDAHEGDAEQDENRFGNERLQDRAERRQRDSDKHQGRDRPGALTAEPGQGIGRHGDPSLQGRSSNWNCRGQSNTTFIAPQFRRHHAVEGRGREVNSRYRL